MVASHRGAFWGRPARPRENRAAQRIGIVGFLLAAALPFVLFHRVLAMVIAEFRLETDYIVTGWTPWILMGTGLLFLLPVAWSAGRDPESRWYPRARNAYAGWGVSLYLLGFALATQVAQITSLTGSPG
jgi:hypothetical protein